MCFFAILIGCCQFWQVTRCFSKIITVPGVFVWLILVPKGRFEPKSVIRLNFLMTVIRKCAYSSVINSMTNGV
jgi:hypothetical protein